MVGRCWAADQGALRGWDRPSIASVEAIKELVPGNAPVKGISCVGAQLASRGIEPGKLLW